MSTYDQQGTQPVEHLRILFEASPDGLFLKDGQGRWLAVNEPGLTLFRLPRDYPYQGKTDLELAERLPLLREAFHACARSDEDAWRAGSHIQVEERIPFPDGTFGLFEVIKVPVFHPDGSRKGLVVMGRDVTARVNAERERDLLLAQEQAARTAAEAAQKRATLLAEASRHLAGLIDDGMAALQEVARLAVVDFADACRIAIDAYGECPARVDEASREPVLAEQLASDVPVIADARARALSENSAVIAAAADPEAPVQAALVAPLRARSRVLGTICFLSRTPDGFSERDRLVAEDLAQRISLSVDNARLFTELKRSHDALARAQQELVRTERLAALGELAAVVAHEVRNPLGAIFNSIVALRKRGATDTDSELLLGVVEEEASRINRIVVDLLDFARPFQLKLEELSLAEIAGDALSSAVRAHPGGAELTVNRRLDPGGPRVRVDPGLMHLALLNVMSNALQAMPEGGALECSLQTVRAGERTWAEVTVSDTGPGIPADVLSRVFEPFYTTRSSGTGLGLAIVKRIVESLQGQVEIASSPGRGTRLSIRVPTVET